MICQMSHLHHMKDISTAEIVHKKKKALTKCRSKILNYEEQDGPDMHDSRQDEVSIQSDSSTDEYEKEDKDE